MALKHVKQSAIVKIAVLIAILASLPKTIFLYDMISQGHLGFSETWMLDLTLPSCFFLLVLLGHFGAQCEYRLCQIPLDHPGTVGRYGPDQYYRVVRGAGVVQVLIPATYGGRDDGA